MVKQNIPYPTSTHIVDELLPIREVHLIAGGSGAGKSTFASQLCEQLMIGGDFFGSPINGQHKVGYLAFDRSEEGMRRTFNRALGPSIPFPFYSTITSKEYVSPKDRDPSGAILRFQELHPEIDILFLDGIGMAFTGDSSSLSEVSRFVQGLVRTLHVCPNPLTIIALHHMGKVKKGNEYAAARSRLHGSVAWAATAETCILIEPEEEENPENPHRVITLCPRNAPERRITYCFDEEGRLIPVIMMAKVSKLDQYRESILALPPTEYSTEYLYKLAEPFSVSIATLKRWIVSLCSDGILERIGFGRYLRTSTGPAQILPMK